MRMRAPLLLLAYAVIGTVLFSPAVVGASGQRRDLPAQGTGTSSLSGRVVGRAQSAPVPRAEVRVTSPSLTRPQSTLTDGHGRWRIGGLPAGSYSISVSKPGYVSVAYGQRRPFGRGTVIDLADAETIERLDVVLPEGGVIAGRVSDQFGGPFAGVHVMAMRRRYVNGQPRLMKEGASDMTDDIGQYRLHSLPPGEYYVHAAVPQALSNGENQSLAYPTTYFPGTPLLSDAQRVVVREGQYLQEINVDLGPMRVATVSGTVRRSTGEASGEVVVSLVSSSPSVDGGIRTARFTPARPDGSFTLAGVMPGEYRVQVQSTADIAAVEATGTTAEMSLAEFASAAVRVTDEDIDGLLVVTMPTATATGAITFEGGRPSASAKSMTVHVVPTKPGASLERRGMVRLHDDWTFDARGLVGRLLFRPSAPSGWVLRSVVVKGEDVTDSGFEFSPGQKVSGITIALAPAKASVVGRVHAPTRERVGAYVVVAFAADPEKWGVGTRFVRTARPNQTGSFVIQGLPPGDYLLFAAEDLEEGEEHDLELLESLRPLATHVRVVEGAPTDVVLTLR